MRQDRFAAELSAWIDGELPGARAAEVAEHVASCASCSERALALRRADAALRAIPLRELAPGALAEVVRQARAPARDDATRAPARRGRWIALAAAASAAAAGVALYLAVRPAGVHPDPLDSASPEDLAVAIDLDTVEDLDVIANLEVLEALVAQEEGRG